MSPSAERIFDHLLAGRVPLLKGKFPRFQAPSESAWYIVSGFDGYLFKMMQVTNLHQVEEFAITATELRSTLRELPPQDCFALAKAL